MKRKNKIVATSIATIALCSSLLVGGTYALFTSESKVNVAVTSGTVSVVASVKDGSVKTYSGAWDNASGSYVDVEQENGAFANGGSATVFQDTNTIQIDRITPMDKVEFEIEIVNNSNVTVQYQTKVELIEGVDLFSALEISIDGKTYDGMTAYSNWAQLLYDESGLVDTVKVSIALPDSENNNDVQGKSVKLAYTVNAVQGNANTENPEAEQNTLYIYNANDMKLFANSVNKGNNFSGKTVKLMSNVDLESEEWTPIGNSSNKFQGTFDGNNKTVSNLKISGNNNYVGLFGYTTNGSVKNLTVNNAEVSGRVGVGVVAGSPYTSTYDNITVLGDVKVNGLSYVGGVLGRNAYANVSNVTVNVNEGSYVNAYSIEDGTAYRTYVGGVIGFMGEGSHTVSNVVSNIDVIGSTIDVGGIVGIAHYGNSFINCVSSGDVTITDAAEEADALEIGGIAGVWNNGGAKVTFTNCSYTGTLTTNVPVAKFENDGLVGKAYASNKDSILELNGKTIYAVGTATGLVAYAKMGVNVMLVGDISAPLSQSAIYGTAVAVIQKGGVLDGNGYSLDIQNPKYEGYAIETWGGTIKNLTIDTAVGRGIMISSPTEDVYLDNVVVDGPGYAVNTTEHNGKKLIVTNSTIKGWTSLAGLDFVSFENCVFGENTSKYWQEMGYDQDYDRLIKPYVNTTFTNCEFEKGYYLDLSALEDGCTVTLTDCTCGEKTITAETFMQYVTVEIYEGQSIVINGTEVKCGANGILDIGGKKVLVANDVTSLQNALNNATDGVVITLTNDITGDVTATQKADVKVAIEGNGYTYAGVIVVDGKSATYTTAGLTIKNLTFQADSISADACIRLGDGTNATRYTCNVTVSGCTFDVPGAVGVKSYTGGDKNLTITGCTATTNAHSLVQAKGIDGVLVEKCSVYSKNGMNFNNSDNVTVSDCTVDVKGYAVRFGESSGGAGAAETYLIKDCTLKSANDDGDAVIILRGTADYATLTITNTTLEGTPDITNTATGATVMK